MVKQGGLSAHEDRNTEQQQEQQNKKNNKTQVWWTCVFSSPQSAKDLDEPNNFGTDDKHHSLIKEMTEIQKHAPGTVNRDEGAFLLSYNWDAVRKKWDCR